MFIVFLFFFWKSHGIEFKDHGFFNFFGVFGIILILLFILIPFNIFIYFIRNKKLKYMIIYRYILPYSSLQKSHKSLVMGCLSDIKVPNINSRI